MKVSLCINIDSRPKNDIAETMFSGVSNWDFWTEGVFNKIKFFDGYDIETIIHADKHKTPPTEVINEILSYSDTIIIRKHTNEEKFNDWNYLRCLSQASGDVVVHFDQDTACFRQSKEYVDYLISLLEIYKIISYPSHWTPNPVVDESFGGKFWASTRFFMCRRETIKLDELKKCIENPDWMYEKYGDSKRRVDWFEHFLAKINGNDVFYPPVELHRGAIFSWKSYKDGVLSILNKQEYEIIKQQILHWGGIQYPCDVTIA